MARIEIKVSSNPHDLVLDPFCGCGSYDETFKKAPQAKARGHAQNELGL